MSRDEYAKALRALAAQHQTLMIQALDIATACGPDDPAKALALASSLRAKITALTEEADELEVENG